MLIARIDAPLLNLESSAYTTMHKRIVNKKGKAKKDMQNILSGIVKSSDLSDM